MAEQPLYAGRRYLIKIHTRETGAVVTAIKYRQAVDSDAHLAATALAKNEFGVVTFTSDQPVGQRARGDWGGIIINGTA